MSVAVTMRVNGAPRELLVEPRLTLLEALRERLQLTGTKEGCSNGNCGSCTVLVDGVAVCSCLMLAVEADGVEITTIEGVAEQGRLHPIQQALIALGGTQCGFCTPGVVLSAKALLDDDPSADEAAVRHAIAGNICRCTGYGKIVDAVLDAARAMRGA